MLQEVRELKEAYRELSLHVYKAFGWDIIDMRFGGLMARIDTAMARLQDYLDGKIENLEELEEERLYFDGQDRPSGGVLGNCNLYHRIVSAGVSGANW